MLGGQEEVAEPPLAVRLDPLLRAAWNTRHDVKVTPSGSVRIIRPERQTVDQILADRRKRGRA